MGASPPSPAQELERASSPLVEVQESGAAPPSPAQEPEQALPTLDLTLLSPPRLDVEAKGLSGADVAQPLTVLPITVWNPPSDKAKSPPRRTTELKRTKLKQKLMQSKILCFLVSNLRQVPSRLSSWSLTLGVRKSCRLMKLWRYLFRGWLW